MARARRREKVMARWRAWWRRGATSSAPPAQAHGSLDRAATHEDRDHLREFVRTRRGVEAYLEPTTTVTAPTVVLVAHDGEWTRRRVPSADVVRRLGNELGIPVYDAGVVGYPRRMREYQRKRSLDD
jgi:hypothetical protein